MSGRQLCGSGCDALFALFGGLLRRKLGGVGLHVVRGR
jgi:hypothetical protein